MEEFYISTGLIIKLIDIWKQQQPITSNFLCYNKNQCIKLYLWLVQWHLLNQHKAAPHNIVSFQSVFSAGYNGDRR